ncbi:WecB/TagA/CpsF family glycosyltransferase [Kaistia geumhonensis]|uniref:N-acetylglucosaminyldiphosphoundecaprenol N-acetyl-beta-D-mannosaminyltransferase n=1 Tax=Kaistia geumhonensis TaxID=410839 RepID=A0ABU0M9C9_9HYPH|nr:WecB/TagA/CpsF family glycosyltransferase [Kaistia geumhonensis]MCX5480722.1 WecB/TagA/CpsF family glycosyltransferase [Kaistia geumhonensis]MDQ0517574.1 N-acetylglucosaminyldiphosphoundecaprenol N-acetyl-beta-D-mannosaminyltransferase [Kaistia geumhonensis]
MHPLSAADRRALVEAAGDEGQVSNILGVRIAAVNLESATARILSAIDQRTPGYVCVRDAHGLVRCQDDDDLRAIHNRAFMVTPDGMPLVWLARRDGHGSAGRVYGPDLMLSVFAAGEGRGVRHYFYGATPATIEALTARLIARFPRAQIAGTFSPPFRSLTPEEEFDVANRINGSGADIVWVGLSTPKQEQWMGRMRDRLDAPQLIGVGAAFDFHAGSKRQAPRFIQRSGFEWAFRLLMEPRRLAGRYAVVIPRFIALTALQRLNLRQFPLGDAAAPDAHASIARDGETARPADAFALPSRPASGEFGM